ncbi:hypothetical protein AX774_g103 [Zancudomyces culisetae]|uniref:Uncharacterized protein n=1 Tax=Zancudomyces culisetae TaxID=1213189 RepID=A0A1R1PZI0_ZANCU|nr:hypothetical protein AX774_g103 [Zancudomyces culisetae]|eukprot:OMH86345.1 hypothetical protein AX774_g103 [Zancudomyces culisetae]
MKLYLFATILINLLVSVVHSQTSKFAVPEHIAAFPPEVVSSITDEMYKDPSKTLFTVTQTQYSTVTIRGRNTQVAATSTLQDQATETPSANSTDQLNVSSANSASQSNTPSATSASQSNTPNASSAGQSNKPVVYTLALAVCILSVSLF